MSAAPLSDVKNTKVFSLMFSFLRWLRIFPTLSSISRTASPYLRARNNKAQDGQGVCGLRKASLALVGAVAEGGSISPGS